MKFLCDNCKAKYQIADEKVAGKTVRMKCRKCQHLIEVKAAVTETSVAKSFPPGAPDAGDRTVVAPVGDLGRSPPRPAPGTKERGNALANAFHRNVDRADRAERPASRGVRELQGSDQWYVAINGVPVGPIRMAELRRKAGMGAVTEQSLCWQEGLEEWRPLRTFPELAAAIDEAVAAGRPSLTPAPGEGRTSSFELPKAGVSARPSTSATPYAPVSRPLAPAARSNVVPISSRLATAERLEEPQQRPSAPFISPPFGSPSAPQNEPVLAPIGAYAPSADAAQKRPTPWIPIAMVVLAAAFGVTAAFAIFVRPAPTAQAPVVNVSAILPPAAPPTQAERPVATSTAQVVEDLPTIDTTTGAHPTTPGAKIATAATGSTPKPMDPEIAKLLGGGPGGPAVGPGAGAGGGGSSLTGEQIEAVVRNYQTGVKRTCWERTGTQQAAVNVKAHLVVGPSGAVQSVNADGNDPVVTKCIENSIRSWKFPPSGTTTRVDIPFHFLRQ